MSSCLSGGGRAIRLDLDIIKSPSTSWISNSPSPSSTLSESSNSQIAISTRKPRTPRKRPNETYNEAAALLSTVYPHVFSTKHITKPNKFTKQKCPFHYDSSDLLLPFQVIENSSFLIHPPMLEKPKEYHPSEIKSANSCDNPCQSPGEINSNSTGNSKSMELCDEFDEDFDAESILDEEIEEGIDSIMGNLCVENEFIDEPNNGVGNNNLSNNQVGTCFGYPVGLGFGVDFEYGFGMRNYIRAFRNYDEGDWWQFNRVNIRDITPRFNKSPVQKKKKKKVVELKVVESKIARNVGKESSGTKKGIKESLVQKGVAKEEETNNNNNNNNKPKPNVGLLLKLNYDGVLSAWSDRDSPFQDDSPAAAEGVGHDVQARLSAIDLFSENGGVREASVLRYKEKRRTRLFSKKIRYQVRKVNADRRPRMKGRFVRRPNSPESEQ